MLSQHFLQNKAQGNPGIITWPKRQVLKHTPVTVLLNISDEEQWLNKEAFTLLGDPKYHGLNITLPMPSAFAPLQSQIHLFKSTPTSASGVEPLRSLILFFPFNFPF